MALNGKRIRGMEEKSDALLKALDGLEDRLDAFGEILDSVNGLFDYYGSEEWYEDREAWEAAGDAVPAGLTAGVLSEDLVYDEISRMRELALRLLETGTDIFKNRL